MTLLLIPDRVVLVKEVTNMDEDFFFDEDPPDNWDGWADVDYDADAEADAREALAEYRFGTHVADNGGF